MWGYCVIGNYFNRVQVNHLHIADVSKITQNLLFLAENGRAYPIHFGKTQVS